MYWENFYSNFTLSVESDFARTVEKSNSIIDFGCGNGRDSLYFAKDRRVLACDSCNTALEKIQHPNIETFCFDFEDEPYLFYQRHNEYDIGYMRFILHAVDKKVQSNILTCAKHSIKIGGKIYIEARSDKGELPDISHYRRLINKDELVDTLLYDSFKIIFIEEGRGFSKTKTEDPVLIRIVAINKYKEVKNVLN